MAECMPVIGWQDDMTLSECCRDILTNRLAADVEFSVGNEKKIVKAHKFILICRSSVFQAMFTNDFADSRETVQIPDIEVDIFEKLLTFMYTDHTEITGETVLSLLYTAKKYSVNRLVRKCLEFLEKGRTSENICEILEQAHFYNENDFREKSVKYILDNAKSVLGSSSFLELCHDCVKMIIEYDELQADERTVLQAVTLWGKHQCEKKNLEKSNENLRTVLGGILYLVRFPLLGETYFTNVVSDTGLLTDAEKVELFKYFYKAGYTTEKFICRDRYATNEKVKLSVTPAEKSEYRTIQTCLRFNRVCEDGSWYCGGEPDAISFTSNQNIWIHGVLVYGTYIGEGNYEVTCSLNDSSETEMVHIRKRIKTVEHQLTYEVLFQDEIEIEKEKRYSVLVKLTNPYGIDTYQGLDGNASVTVGDVKFNFTKSKNSRNGTDVKIGQIPGLLFSTSD